MATITLNRKEFLAEVDNCLKFVPKRASHPVLEYVLIELRLDYIYLTATDLSAFYYSCVSFDFENSFVGEDSFKICLNLKELKKALKGKEKTVLLELDKETVTLVNGGMITKISISPSENFPNVSETFDGSFEIEDFSLVVKAAEFASDDVTKGNLTGVYLDTVSISATNGHFLIRSKNELENVPSDFSVTILGSVIKGAGKVFDNPSVSCLYNSEWIDLRQNKKRILTRILEGQYPNVKQLITKAFNYFLEVDRKKLLEVLLAGDFKESLNVVKFTFDSFGSGELKITDKKEAFTSVLKVNSDLTFNFALNVEYLKTTLKALTGETVKLSFNSATSPIVVTEGETTILLMPFQIKD